jgi:hypothetical protein
LALPRFNKGFDAKTPGETKIWYNKAVQYSISSVRRGMHLWPWAIGLLSEEIDRNMAMMGIQNPSQMSMEYMRPMR